MAGADTLLAGPYGPHVAILVMALATYLCRIAGVVIMSRVSLTPAIERGLAALPGSIVAATVAPLALKAGPAGILAVVSAILVARLARNELLALVAGLAVAAGARAVGL